MPPLRIGLIGAGWVTEHHLDAYATMPERARVVAIADPDPQARARRATAYSIPQTFASASEMLAEVVLDAVDVASPRENHAEGCRLAAQRGLPVLCQKPLAPTLAEAQQLIAGLPAGSRLMVHENWRFRPHYRQIAAWLREGRIGPPRQAVMRILTSGLVPDPEGRLPALERQPMMARLRRMLLMEVMIHHVDALRFLLGPMELLAAELGQDCGTIAGEDRAMLMLRAGRVSVVLVGDFMAHGREAAQLDRLEILGRDGAVRLDGDHLALFHGAQAVEALTLDLAANYKASYAGAIRHFLDRLADGAPFETAPDDNLKTLALIERAYAQAAPSPSPAA